MFFDPEQLFLEREDVGGPRTAGGRELTLGMAKNFLKVKGHSEEL